MYRSTIDIIFNALLLVFWFRIWIGKDDRDTFFNPYLNAIDRFADAAMGFLQPVFVGLPHKAIAAIALLFMAIFRGVVYGGLSGPGDLSWVLTFGFLRATPASDSVLNYVSFSVLSFLVFLFKLWSIEILYRLARRGRRESFDHPTTLVRRLSLPMSAIRNTLALPSLIAIGMIIGLVLEINGTPIRPTAIVDLQRGSPIAVTIALAVVSLSALVDVLVTLSDLMVLLIIGSLVASFTGSRGVMHFCREWIDMLLGPFNGRRAVIGMFDLTPLIFLMAISMLIHPVFMTILQRVFASLS